MSSSQLDQLFKKWLFKTARSWRVTPKELANRLGRLEYTNRDYFYPKIQQLLLRRNWKIAELRGLLGKCWSLGGQFDSTRISPFLAKESSERIIRQLIRKFPTSDQAAAARIDEFIALSTKNGIRENDGRPDASAATLLASILLSCMFPKRFSDLRPGRWTEFAPVVHYEKPCTGSYGEKVVWAGHFARAIGSTPTFKKYWPKVIAQWRLSGIRWRRNAPDKNEDPIAVTPKIVDEFVVAEGKLSEQRHFRRKRNASVVRLAKERAFELDKLLRCEVCDFSFKKHYGQYGEGFIEAHHTQPLSKRIKESKTKISDIALLCANCHRMIHRKNGSVMTLEKLKAIYKP